MSDRTGADIATRRFPRETFAALGFPGAEDLTDMFEYYRLHIPSRARDIETCRALAPELQSFDTWLACTENRLRAALVSRRRQSPSPGASRHPLLSRRGEGPRRLEVGAAVCENVSSAVPLQRAEEHSA